MYRYVRILLILLCALPAAASVSAGSQQELIEDASQHHRFDPELRPLAQLIGEGEHDEALSLGREMAAEWAGDPPFDYLFGMAALGAGAYNEAAFAFERILILNPEHHRARLELGRAYFMNENWHQARIHFQRVLDADPPRNVQRNINQFLSLIEEREDRQTHSFDLFGHYGFGYDSNVNSATDAESLRIDLGQLALDVTLNEESRESSDQYHNYGLESTYRRPITQRSGITLSAEAERKDNLNENDFDLDTFNLGSHYHRRLAPDTLMRVGLKASQSNLDGQRLQWRTGLSSELRYLYSPRAMIFGSVSPSAIRYPGSRSRDVDQLILGLGARFRADSLDYQISASGGAERARDRDARHNGRWLGGLSGHIAWRPGSDHRIKTQLVLTHSRHNDTQPPFSDRRREQALSLITAWQWSLTDRLRLRTEARYNRRESSLIIFDYDRARIEMGLRYQFF